MKILKIAVASIVIIYVLIVVVFETNLGYTQPQSERTMVITTRDDEGTGFDRVVTPIRHNDKLYVAVNHWPRAWYWRALDNPNVDITMGGETAPYQAVEVEGGEYDAADAARPRSLRFLALTGFPPRRILRLDPQVPAE